MGGGSAGDLPYQGFSGGTSSLTLPIYGTSSQQGSNGGAPEAEAGNSGPVVREQDRFMPIANVIRIMRRILPPHAKISDDAKETIQECVSEYISFITGEANDRCQKEQRKTITAEDVLWAMGKLGFDDYVEPLTVFLNRYRDNENDRSSYRDPILKRSSAGVLNHGMPLPPQFGPGYPMPPPPPVFGGGYYRDPAGNVGGSNPNPNPNQHPNSNPNQHLQYDPFGQFK
ncbi:nuclear transcription factor Y subunit B-4-like [Euphorbia lathyris]|uniref:nuclear transcription factor Y subunit B-4-like n=1 Tax=Euphorbia lathyris TaxID=212925 RepID=UPI00331418DD